MEFDPQVLAQLKWDEEGLIPAVIQDAASDQVLMVAYMNRESLKRTLASGQTWFFSRSRQELWWKGATSGHFQEVQEITADCDYDTLLVRVDQEGGIACHEGVPSCFHNPLTEPEPAIMRRGDPRVTGQAFAGAPAASAAAPATVPAATVLDDLVRLIRDRKENPQGDSYTCRLFTAGLDRICRKVGEEASEVIIAAKNETPQELASEAADLVYHLLVLLAQKDVPFDRVLSELSHRRSAGHGGDGRGGERPKSGV